MEVIVVLVILGGVVARALRKHTPRSNHHIRPRHQQKRARHPQSRARLRPLSKAARPRPFDAATARHEPSPGIIVGHARIIDGDSIVIQKTQIRLFGIDAPELNHPYGKNAKWALIGLCKGKHVRAEILERDAYGRTVARCYLPDGRDLSAEMVKRGWAIDWPKFSGGKYRQLEVADARKKMWLADARQKGRIHVWAKFEARNR